jgi:NAD(P)-dependent dehydrogenase (short-subunit alcohol dehydrogenase family)
MNGSFPSLNGRSVFVTGGASGIGASLVTAFLHQGAAVAFVDIDSVSAAKLLSTLSHHSSKVWWRQCDVTDIPELQRAIAEASAALGDFHVLVNNVATDERHSLDSVTPDYWDNNIAVNQRPAFFAIQATVPGMRRRGGGSVINMGSTGWQTKAAGYPCYAVAKSSVNGLTRGLARELGRDRIRINTVSPGWVMTDKQKRLWLDADGEAEIERNQCLPDRLQPEDVTAMVLFLAADDSEMCTAQEFIVDGGWR